MANKRILLIESGRFIGGVIHSLFAQNDQLTVIEAAPTNSRELLSAVRKHRPEIIVLDDTVRDEYLAQLMNYMTDCAGIQVVVVNTGCNRVEVYQKQQVDVNRSADFFALL